MEPQFFFLILLLVTLLPGFAINFMSQHKEL